MIDIHFIPFPKPKALLENCVCDRLSFMEMQKYASHANDISRNHYVCTEHFVNVSGPTIPTVGGEIETAHNIAKPRKWPPPYRKGMSVILPRMRELQTKN
jgi:hypothetical protein